MFRNQPHIPVKESSPRPNDVHIFDIFELPILKSMDRKTLAFSFTVRVNMES